MTALDDLLVVQDHDSAVDRLRHRLATLPERAELAAVEQEMAKVEGSLGEARRTFEEAAAEQRRQEDELSSVEAKAAELDRRLYSGTVTIPRELQALQADLESLNRRRSALEERVLEAMEVREPLEAESDRITAEQGALGARAEQLRGSVAEASAALEAELAAELAARTEAAGSVPADLLARYEQLRARLDGVGAARLVQGSCTGCHLSLSATALDAMKRQPPDALVYCEQCGRILVPSARAPTSGTP